MTGPDELDMLIALYKSGKQIEAMVRTHNSDEVSRLMILLLSKSCECTVSDVAKFAGIRLSAATAKIARMEADGLLMRVSGGDRRSHRVAITEAGQDYAQALVARIRVHMSEVQLGLTKKEIETLVRLIQKISWEGMYAKNNP